MADAPARIVTCPHCRKRMAWSSENAHRPFCSERCRLIDLGAWASDTYRIDGSSQNDDVLSGDLQAD